MVILLGCLDQCDDTALAFLSHLHRYFTTSDCRMKIVITTTKATPKEKFIINSLKAFPQDRITEIDYTFPTRVPIELGFEVSMLIQEVGCQHVGIERLREVFMSLLSQTVNDQELSLLVIGWLKSHRKSVAAATRLLTGSKEIGPESIFEVILSEIPEERQRWAERLISWMLSSFRPLRTFEIYYLSDLCLDTHYPAHECVHLDSLNTRQSLSHALQYFGGMLTVVHDEIHFSHPGIRDWLSSESHSNDLWYRAKPESCRHLDILEICVMHLSNDTGAPDDWTALLPYVTEFWTEHYRFAEAKARGSFQVLERVLQSPPTLRRWIKAHALLPTPFIKPLEASYEPLTIAAHFGLDDIVDHLCSLELENTATQGQALIESARGAQLFAFRIILRSYNSAIDFENPHLHDAVVAASSHGNHDLFYELVCSIRKPPRQATEHQQDLQERVHSGASDERKNENEHPHDDAETFVNHGTVDGEDPTKSRIESPNDANQWDNVPGLMEPKSSAHWLAFALSRASALGLDSVIDELLSLGANPDSLDSMSPSRNLPLHLAAQFDHLGTAEKLLAAGASIQPRTVLGYTPLHKAIISGTSRVMKLLLDRGASIDDTSDAWLPLNYASNLGRFEATEVLVQYRKPEEYFPPDLAYGPLYNAVSKGHYKTTEVLLRHGADPNACDSSKETVLMAAVRIGRLDLCRLLLEHGSLPDFTPEECSSPLIQAVRFENLDMVKLLVEKGADVEKREVPGAGWNRTPGGPTPILERKHN